MEGVVATEMGAKRVLALGSLVVAVLSIATSASATYPGANGEIAYERYGGKRVPTTLRTVFPDGNPGRVLARPRVGHADAAWSADGTQVAMVLGKEPNRIVLLDVETDERSLVIRSEDVPDSRFIESMSISPDGQTLVFCSVGRPHGTSLFTVGVDGSALADISGSHEDCQPDWGPNGRIAAESSGWSPRLVTMEPDGSDRFVVFSARDADRSIFLSAPSWSPDAARIVMGATNGREGRPDLWIVDADGADLTALTDTPRRAEWDPIFSPDGALIAYLVNTAQEGFGFSDLATMAVDGSDRQRLTRTPKRRESPLSWQPIAP
jgi:Tol biopolymer transport system component